MPPQTTYIVLGQDASGNWRHLKAVEAHSAEHAIRQVAKEGTYVAVPGRSWNPVSVKIETTTTLKISDLENVTADSPSVEPT